MVFGSLSGAYIKVEESWYKLVDKLSAKGIPLYTYTDFLDKRGIPSFPFTIALAILIIILLYFTLSSTALDVSLQFRFLDDEGSPLNGVVVEVRDAQERELLSRTLSSGSSHTLKNMPFNSAITVTATKAGYDPPEPKPFTLNSKEQNITFQFNRQREYITGMLRLHDDTTFTVIMNASCTATPGDRPPIQGENHDNNIHFRLVPDSEPVEVSCDASGYETFNQMVSFYSGRIIDAAMSSNTTGQFAAGDLADVLIRAIDDETGELIPDVNVTIINAENDDKITDGDVAPTGEYIAELVKNTTVKVTLEATGYITEQTLPFTVVEGLKPVEVRMEKGGQAVTIEITSKATGYPLSNVELSLYDQDGRLITSKKTLQGPFGGIAAFENLDPNKTYFLTAHKNGFLPFRKLFNPTTEPYLEIELVPSDPNNSANLTLKVLDSTGNPANKARVSFYQEFEGKRMPLGIPPQETSAQGTVAVNLPEGEIEVVVETDLEKKSFMANIVPGQNTEETLELERKDSIVELKFLDNEGNPIDGTVTIKSKSGEILFEGRPDSSGSVVFDSKGEETFDVDVETEDGRTFEEEVRIDGEEEAEVTLYTVEERLRPQIDFVGVFDARGRQVEGVTRGDYYWLKFVASWSAVEQAGVHVRLGTDDMHFSDAMEYGIYGTDAVSKRIFYGKSYQAPLGTREDRLNRGKAGEKNKAIELYFDEPADQQVVKIKVKASENSRVEEMPVFYRAWVKAGGKFFRDPEDGELGTEESTAVKGSFYAMAKTDSVRIFSSAPKCSKGLCLEYAFWDEENQEFAPQDFRPVIGRAYSLEVKATSVSQKEIQLAAETGVQSEMLLFAEFVEGTGIRPPSGYDKPSVSSPSLSVSAFEEKSARAFFETIAEGAAYIKVTAQDGEEQVEKTLYFDVTGLKAFALELSGNGKVKPGEELHVTIKDAETGGAIEDALITFYSGERPIFSIAGDGFEGTGMEGFYSISAGSLDPGIYTMAVSRRDYIDSEAEVTVSVDEILSLDPEKEIELDKSHKERIETIEIRNNLPNAAVEAIDYEFFPRSNWNNNFSLTIRTPAELRGGAASNISLTVIYTGDEDARVHAEGELEVTGVLASGLVVKATSTIKANYNKPVPVDCLEITPALTEVRILGEENSSESFKLRVNYLQSEECTEPLALSAWADPLDAGEQDITVSSPTISISPGEEKELAITVTNLRGRFAEPEESKDFSIVIESERVSKSVRMRVYFINPMFSLQTNDNIHLWATPDEETGKITGIAPLYMRNVGKKTIENITAGESGLAGQSREFSVIVKPTAVMGPTTPTATATLAEGEEISPPWTIEVTGEASEYPEFIYPIYLDISGEIDGKRYPAMRTVTVHVHISTANCLKFSRVDDLWYESSDSSQGVISKKVRLENDCGEIIREITIVPSLLGENQLSLHQSGERNILYPGEEDDFQLKLLKRSDYFNEENPDQIVARGFLVSSQKFIESNPLGVVVMLGDIPDTGTGPVFDAVNIPVCETDGQLKSVHFPKVAHDKDCENAYCDSVQFSEFLADKLLDTVDEAEDKMRDAGYEVSNPAISCSGNSPYCSFSSLGINMTDHSHTVFLRNDHVSAEVIEKGLEGTDLGNFSVSFRSGEISEIIEGATGFSAFNLYLSEPLKGCGRYRITLNGAVQNTSGTLQPENLILMVKVSEGRKITPECTNKVQNAMNFLPVDSGLQGGLRLNTWLGMIETDQRLNDVGGDFAEALFGQREGRVTRSDSTTNRLKILLKDIGEGRIMRISIDQRSETTATPKKITLELNGLFDEAEDLVRNEMATKAKEALRAMSQGSFELDACISDSEEYLTMQRFEKLGELAISGDKKLPLYYDTKACASLKVMGTMPGEKVVLKTNWSALSGSDKAGISRVWLESTEGREIAGYDSANPTPVQLEAIEGKEGLNEELFLLCAEGDNGFAHQAIGKKLKVMAKSFSIEDELDDKGKIRVREMKEWFEVEIEICGMHPYELLDKISGMTAGEEEVVGYTVLGWKGQPDELTLDSMIAAWKAFKQRRDAVDGEDGELTIDERLDSARKWSIWAYFAACMGAATICNGMLLKAWWIPFDWILDCGVPTITGFFGRQIAEGSKGIWEGMEGYFHTENVDELVDRVQDATTGDEDADETIDQIEEDLLTGAMAGVSFRGLSKLFNPVSGPLASFGKKTYYSAAEASSAIKATASTIADDTAEVFTKNYLSGAAGKRALERTMKKSMEENLRKGLTEAAEGAGRRGFKMTDLDLDGVSRGSWDEATKTVTGLDDMQDLLKGSRFSKNIDNLVTRQLDEALDVGKIADNSMGDIFKDGDISFGGEGRYGSIDSLADDLTDNVKSAIDYDSLVSKNSALSGMDNEIRRDILERLRNGGYEGTGISRSQTKNLVNDSVRKAKLKHGDDLFEAFGKSIDDEVGELFAKNYSSKAKLPKHGRIRNFFRSLRSFEFWKRLGKSMACGVAANLAGISAQRAVMNYKMREITADVLEEEGFSFAGPLAGYEGVDTFKKFKPYKITIWKGDFDETRVKIEELLTDECLTEMSEDIAADAEKFWHTNCDKFMERGIDELIGCLIPDADKEGVTTSHVQAYYSSNALIAEVSLGSEPKIEEDLLMAIMFTKPQNIEGCCTLDGDNVECIDPEWYKKSEGEIESSLRCAASELRSAISQEGWDIESGENVLEGVVARLSGTKLGGSNLTDYVKDILEAFDTWKEFNYCRE